MLDLEGEGRDPWFMDDTEDRCATAEDLKSFWPLSLSMLKSVVMLKAVLVGFTSALEEFAELAEGEVALLLFLMIKSHSVRYVTVAFRVPKGIRISSKEKASISSEVESFTRLFRPILPLLEMP